MRGRRTWHRVRVSRVAREVVKRRLTYLGFEKLHTLERHAGKVKRTGVPGNFVEAGVALGGSGIVLARQLDDGREYHGYDVFGQIPPPTEHDGADSQERYEVIARGESEGIGGDPYYGYVPDLRDRVADALSEFGVSVGEHAFLHEGTFDDQLRPSRPVALAHIDCDWYEPVLLCLNRLGAALSPGGFLVLDDFHDYEGCAQAAREFLDANSHMSVVADAGSLVLGAAKV